MKISVEFDIPNDEICGLLESAGELRFMDGAIRVDSPLPDAIRRSIAQMMRGGPPLPPRVFRNVHETDVSVERLYVIRLPERGEVVDEVLAHAGVPQMFTRATAKIMAYESGGTRKQVCSVGELARWAGVKR